MKKLWILLALLASLLNFSDALFTVYGVSKGLEEGNPLMRFALDNNFFLQIKVLVSIAICLCCLKIDSLVIKAAVTTVLIMYSLITIMHIIVLKSL